jgi:hypothetical protein
LLEKEDWECGEYFIGGTIEVFAHFMERIEGHRRESVATGHLVRGGGGGVRRMNPDATTAYSLCMPTERQYFSRAFVFIPEMRVSTKGKLAQAGIAECWPGFDFSAGVAPKVHITSVDGSLRLAAPTGRQEARDSEEESDDRMSSPEFEYASAVVMKGLEEQKDSFHGSVGALDVNEQEMDTALEGLESERTRSEESEGLFVSE